MTCAFKYDANGLRSSTHRLKWEDMNGERCVLRRCKDVLLSEGMGLRMGISNLINSLSLPPAKSDGDGEKIGAQLRHDTCPI